MLPGVPGVLLIVIGSELDELVPQVLLALTLTLPDNVPIVTLTDVVPCPLLMVASAGTVQV